MAKILDEYEFVAGRGNYPEEWLDGKIRELKAGEDYHVKATSVKQSLKRIAKAKGKELRVNITDDGNKMVVQAISSSGGRRGR